MTDTSVLLLSMRGVSDLVAYCSAYEFEDVVEAVTDAHRIDVDRLQTLEFSRRAYKFARFVTGSSTLARRLAPGPRTARLTRDYDLFFPVFNHPYELYSLATVPDWRSRCRRSACFIVELWPHLLPAYLLELLADFDRIFVGSSHIAADVARLTGRPCTYVPIAADVLGLAPPMESPARTIDVCYIGRRSQVTHEALLALERERRDFFYYYDTVAASGVDRKQRTFHVESASEHRHLLGSILRRTRYYVANRARVNEPTFTAGGDQISLRFYEGAATGTVMLGEPPRSREFEHQFDWEDAVVPMPFDAPDIASTLADLDGDPARVETIRRRNIRCAALRHDWLYRVRAVLDAMGINATDRMVEREAALRKVAEQTGIVDEALPIVSQVTATATDAWRLPATEARARPDSDSRGRSAASPTAGSQLA